MITVRYDELSSALDFVSDGAPVEHSAYVSLDTGKIYFTSSELDDEFDGEIPGDLQTPDRYLEIPHRNELDLGRSLALRFTAHELPVHYDQVEDFFRGGVPMRASRHCWRTMTRSSDGLGSKLAQSGKR